MRKVSEHCDFRVFAAEGKILFSWLGGNLVPGNESVIQANRSSQVIRAIYAIEAVLLATQSERLPLLHSFQGIVNLT